MGFLPLAATSPGSLPAAVRSSPKPHLPRCERAVAILNLFLTVKKWLRVRDDIPELSLGLFLTSAVPEHTLEKGFSEAWRSLSRLAWTSTACTPCF